MGSSVRHLLPHVPDGLTMKNDQLTLLGGALSGLRLPLAPIEHVSAGTLFIEGQNLNVGKSDGSYSSIPLYRVNFDFTEIVLTNAGADGHLGPTLAQARTAYRASNPWVDDANFFGIAGDGVQTLVVPRTGRYRLSVYGGGRQSNASTGTNARLNRLTVEVTLAEGWLLYVIVGQRGKAHTLSGSLQPSGGGGGTFVWCKEYDPVNPIVVSGGSGGRTSPTGAGNYGPMGITGQYLIEGAWSTPSAAPSSGRQGGGLYGTGTYGAASGAGWRTTTGWAVDGMPPDILNDPNGEPKGAGGIRAAAATYKAVGGFGGGGCYYSNGVVQTCGGGGGYYGGSFSYNTSNGQCNGGAGSSYVNSKTKLISTANFDTLNGHGQCTLTWLGE